MIDLEAYLRRIDYYGPVAPSAETLQGLHRAHLLSVPFENLDIHLGRKIIVDEEAILHKIIAERRGGFCYELNGAFAALLHALGFQVTLLSARVARATGGEGPEFDHLTLRVDVDGPWLADVGFGDSFLEPLRLEPAFEQSDPAGCFRLTYRTGGFLLQRLRDGSWKAEYSFTLQPRRLEDFAGMCHYHQTSPDSSFTRNRICSRATPEGRVTLSGLKLIETGKRGREERTLDSEQEWVESLKKHFGILRLPEAGASKGLMTP
jgi:N-hydroxyarylamine O-acetyltransferase